MFFRKMSQLNFVEKTMQNHDFWILEISKNAKTLFFPLFFAKNENFDESASWWSEKKIFRGGPDGPNIVFNTLLWHAAIKICGRLMKFSHFWWFDFFDFLEAQKSKNAKFSTFSPKFHQFCSFFCYFSRFLSPKSISFIKILLLGCRLVSSLSVDLVCCPHSLYNIRIIFMFLSIFSFVFKIFLLFWGVWANWDAEISIGVL